MDQRSKVKLFVISAFVFIVLNGIENIIHFSIGRSIETKDNLSTFNFEMPTFPDFVKIIGVMIVFAILQASFTCYFDGC